MLIEGYGKVKAGIFKLKADRAKEVMGLVNTTLSSGSFSISSNALLIVKKEVSERFAEDIPAMLTSFRKGYQT